MSGHFDVHRRPHASIAVVSTALAVGFVPKAERNAHDLRWYRVYQLVAVRRNPRLSLSLSPRLATLSSRRSPATGSRWRGIGARAGLRLRLRRPRMPLA